MIIKDIVASLRPQQWVKNVVLFAGLIFSQNFFNPYKGLIVFVAAFIFCLASSGVYLINDVLDLEWDKKHPQKKLRPIASGKISLKLARLIGYFLIFWAIIAASFLNNNFAFIIALYAFVELFYSIILKHEVILDVFCIASGFLLRVLAGAVVINVPISNWLLICTIFISLFLALAKRRYEIVLLETDAKDHRRVLSEYSLSFIDQMITIVTASTILAYVLYVFSPETMAKFHTKNLVYSIIFVVYGIFRYLYLVYQKKQGGSPEKLLFSDKPLMFNLILYVVFVIMAIYPK